MLPVPEPFSLSCLRMGTQMAMGDMIAHVWLRPAEEDNAPQRHSPVTTLTPHNTSSGLCSVTRFG